MGRLYGIAAPTGKGVDENGDEFGQTIYINKVNPKSATIVEIGEQERYVKLESLILGNSTN